MKLFLAINTFFSFLSTAIVAQVKSRCTGHYGEEQEHLNNVEGASFAHNRITLCSSPWH